MPSDLRRKAKAQGATATPAASKQWDASTAWIPGKGISARLRRHLHWQRQQLRQTLVADGEHFHDFTKILLEEVGGTYLSLIFLSSSYTPRNNYRSKKSMQAFR